MSALAAISDDDERRVIDVAQSVQQDVESFLLCEPSNRADDWTGPGPAPRFDCDVGHAVVDRRNRALAQPQDGFYLPRRSFTDANMTSDCGGRHALREPLAHAYRWHRELIDRDDLAP